MTKIASETKCTIVVVGDSRTGKSALLHRFVHKSFQPVYMPTSFDKSFGQQEVNKHLVHFSFWDTSGSPAYDSVRPLSYQEADVFLLCYKISDPISLYNVKNKWIRELRQHRPDVPVILCGCQSDLRQDMATLNHLSKTGRTPISSDQALAICCEIQAVNYVETSAKLPRDTHNISEAFELCALAAIRKSQKTAEKAKNSHGGKNSSNTNSILNNINMTNFKRSPSINSSLSLFEPMPNHMVNNQSDLASNQNCNNNLQLYKKSQVNHHGQLRHSYRYQASLIAPPPLNSPSSFSECDARLSTFSPEPLSLPDQPPPPPTSKPPSILENSEAAYQSDSGTSVSVCSFQTFQNQNHQDLRGKRPTSLALRDNATLSQCPLPASTQQPQMRPQSQCGLNNKPQRPTTLFKTQMPPCYSPQTLITPSGDPKNRLINNNNGAPPVIHQHIVSTRRFDSLSELPGGGNGNSTTNISAMIRPNCLSRRTSYRTYQKVPIPVAAPMSPVGSDYSFDLKSPTGSSQCFSPEVPGRLEAVSEDMEATCIGIGVGACGGPTVPSPVCFEKTYESLKSTCSSQNSSKASSTASEASRGASSTASSGLDLSTYKLRLTGKSAMPGSHENALSNTEDPNLIKNLNFVSPKTGVYRPLPEGSRGRYKQSCNVM